MLEVLIVTVELDFIKIIITWILEVDDGHFDTKLLDFRELYRFKEFMLLDFVNTHSFLTVRYDKSPDQGFGGS